MIDRIKDFKPGLQKTNKRELYFNGIKSVVLLGDCGCRPPPLVDIKAFKRILKIKTDFFIIIGDLVFRGRSSEFRKLLKLCREKAKIPIFTLTGNHDLPRYNRFCGRSSYAIILDRFGFICLYNPRGKFKQGDIDLLKKTLKKHKDKKFFVLFHIPPPMRFHTSHIKRSEWGKIRGAMDKFKKRVICVFCGHIHALLNYRLDGYNIVVTGGGGALLFDLKQDMLNEHHAIKLSNLDKGSTKSEVIAVSGKKRHINLRI